MAEVVGAFGGGPSVEEAADDRPESVIGAGRGLAQQRLELGEQLLDRVQARALGRQVEDRRASGDDRLAWKIHEELAGADQAVEIV